MTNGDLYYRKGAARKSKQKVYGRILKYTQEYFEKNNIKESCYITAAGKYATDVIWILRRFDGAIKAVYSAEFSLEIYENQVECMNKIKKTNPDTHFSSFNGNLADIPLKKEHNRMSKVVFIDLFNTIDSSISIVDILLLRKVLWKNCLMFLTVSLNPRVVHQDRFLEKHKNKIQILKPELTNITKEYADLYAVDALVRAAVQSNSRFEDEPLDIFPICKLKYRDTSQMGVYGYYIDTQSFSSNSDLIDKFDILN